MKGKDAQMHDAKSKLLEMANFLVNPIPAAFVEGGEVCQTEYAKATSWSL